MKKKNRKKLVAEEARERGHVRTRARERERQRGRAEDKWTVYTYRETLKRGGERVAKGGLPYTE